MSSLWLGCVGFEAKDPSCGGPVLLLTLRWFRTVFGPVILLCTVVTHLWILNIHVQVCGHFLGHGSWSSAQRLGLERQVGPDPSFHLAPLNLSVQQFLQLHGSNTNVGGMFGWEHQNTPDRAAASSTKMVALINRWWNYGNLVWLGMQERFSPDNSSMKTIFVQV